MINNLQLASVRVLCQSGPEVLLLPHVAKLLNDFLDYSANWSLIQACKANSLHMARRLVQVDAVDPFYASLRPFTKEPLRHWQFSQSLIACASTGNLELAELLCRYFDRFIVSRPVILAMIQFGRLEMLQWLVRERDTIEWLGGNCEVGDAIKWRRLEMAKWLLERGEPTSVPQLEHWAQMAAENGDLEALQWVCSLSGEVDSMKVLTKAVDNCHLDVVKWVLARAQTTGEIEPRHEEDVVSVNTLDDLAARGQDWRLLHQNLEKSCINRAAVKAAQNGHFELLRLLFMSNCHFGTVFRAAASSGHLDIVRWLHERRTLSTNNMFKNATDAAAANGFLDVVKWLHENTSERATTLAMDGAAANGHFGTLKWLYEHSSEEFSHCTMDNSDDFRSYGGCMPSAMNSAAANGHLDIMRWLHDRNEACTTVAMNNAAANGHLDIVQWLHYNRTEGCTTTAIDSAAANGHLVIVKWLHHHRSEGWTGAAMDRAVENCHLPVVEWLHEHGAEVGYHATNNALRNGHMKVVQWLVSHGYTSGAYWARDALASAVLSGHFGVIRCINTDFNDSVGVAKRHLNGRNEEFLEWSRTHGPTEFERQVAAILYVL